MSKKVNYIPKPSRTQNQCTFTLNSSYNSVYIPSLQKTVTPSEAILYDKELYKESVLKYTVNTSKVTKTQKYSQISKGLWSNRTKTFATQSQTYSNPNTTSFLRLNSTNILYNNQIVGSPNNFAGPFQINIPNPYGCDTNSIADGGNLICGINVNPCSNKVIGSIIKPNTPILLSAIPNCSSIILNWAYYNNPFIYATSFNVYDTTGKLYQTLSYSVTSTIISDLLNYNTYSFYVVAFGDSIESDPSNILSAKPLQLGAPENFIGSLALNTACPAINLSWTQPTDCISVLTGYNIYFSNGLFIAFVPYTQTYYTVTNLNYDTSYNFLIVTTGQDYYKSTTNTLQNFIHTSTIQPPTGFSGTAYASDVTLTWLRQSVNCVKSYNIYASNGTSQNVLGNSCIFSNLIYNVVYDFSINAVDYFGNVSTFNTCSVTTNTANLPPINVTATISQIYTPGIHVSWVPTPSFVPITNWVINYVNLTTNVDISLNIPNVNNNTTFVDISNVNFDSSYNITVRSVSNTYYSTPSTPPAFIYLQPLYTILQGNFTYSLSNGSQNGIIFDNYLINHVIKFNYNNYPINLLMIGGGSGGSCFFATSSRGGGGGGGGGIVNTSFMSVMNSNYNIGVGKGGLGSIFTSGDKAGSPGTSTSFNYNANNYSASGSRIAAGKNYGIGGNGYYNGALLNNSFGGTGGAGQTNPQVAQDGSSSNIINKNVINSTIYLGGGGGGGAIDISGGYAGQGTGGTGGNFNSINGQNANNGSIAINTYSYGGGGGGGAYNIIGGNGGNGGNGAVILYWNG
jgi:hypothetical protein